LGPYEFQPLKFEWGGLMVQNNFAHTTNQNI